MVLKSNKFTLKNYQMRHSCMDHDSEKVCGTVIRVVGTYGPSRIKAGNGISNLVSKSNFSLLEMKQESAVIQNSEL
jgi:hypothetical protein